MQYGRALLALSLCCAGATAARAESPRSKGDFSCYHTSDFGNAVSDNPNLRINNFTLEERKAVRYNTAGLLITYAATNHASEDQWLTADFILLDGDDEPLAAITAGPPHLTVKAKGAAIGQGNTTVYPGILARTISVCLRIHSNPI